MKSKDLISEYEAKILVIGEDSNLVWNEEVPEFVMFADYYFKPIPQDHGERSRNVESRRLFEHIIYLTNNKVKSKEIYFTNLCNEYVTPPPKGKHVLIPEEKAIEGVDRIKKILKLNPTITYVFCMSLQANYWLQKLGLYTCNDETFLHNAQPKRVGLEQFNMFYQPVNPKAFSLIAGNIYDAIGYDTKIVPILPAKDFPLKDRNLDLFQTPYLKIKESLIFNQLIKDK
ncbi:MAG: hypothetical protein PHD62_04415 [Bacteroidales bacterium]|nr:hypothetical protein [Bacteroidales bacterium]